MSNSNEQINSQEQTPQTTPTEPAKAETATAAETAEVVDPGKPESLIAAGTESEVASTPFDAEKFEWPENITDEGKTQLVEFAGKYRISSEAASAMLAMHAEALQKAADGFSSEGDKAWNTQVNEYIADTRKAYGDRLPEVQQHVERVLNEFGSQALRDQLVATGLGNNLAVFQFMEKIAKATGEAKPVPSTAEPAKPTGLEAMYPSMAKKE